MAERSAGESHLAAIEYELNQERAATLGRYGRQAEQAIAECQALLDRLDTDDPDAVAAYRQARQIAVEAVDALCLQREVLRLFDDRRVHEIYRVPPPV